MSEFVTQTPSQTVGPFYAIGLVYGEQNVLISEQTRGQRIMITGRLLDGDNNPVVDGCLEVWQADSNGYFNHPADPNHDKADRSFKGWGRAQCGEDGRFEILTIRPGPVQNPDGSMLAPHIAVHVFGRGMLLHTRTRFFFSNEAEANANDSVFNAIPEDRRDTIIMQLADGDSNLPTYHIDVKLQGEDETVFFDIFE